MVPLALLTVTLALAAPPTPSVADRLATATTAFRYDVAVVPPTGDDGKDPLRARGVDVSIDGWWLTARGRKKGEALGFGLTHYHYAVASDAAAALKRYLDTADPNTGHSYAWDFALLDETGGDVWLIDAPCLYSHQNFIALTDALRKITGVTSGDAVICSCGGGCGRMAAPH